MNSVRSLDFQGEKNEQKSPYDVNSYHSVSINELKLVRRVGEITVTVMQGHLLLIR